jgi:hypothetical protein
MGVACREGTAYSGTPVFAPVSEHDVFYKKSLKKSK